MLFMAFSLNSFVLFAQMGKNGALTTSTTSILNDYTPLTANAAAGTNLLNVVSSALNTRIATPLAAGDLIFIIQMQGASMSTPDDSTYGSLINYNNCGNFEFAEVADVPFSTQIITACQLKNNYTASGRTQVVRVPRLTTLTVGSGGSMTCPAWDGSTGGVLILEVQNGITINSGGTINATGKGFRAGQNAGDNNTDWGVLNYRWPANNYGAEKGEGIGGSQTDYDGMSGRYSKGAPLNGGGGANAHNAGGGGGGNCGTLGWTGRGVPNVSTGSWASAWNLEYVGFAVSNSSGGGKGGYSFSGSDQNALAVGPFNAAWGGDARRDNGGRGGRPLDYSTGRIFMGGGGGAGDQNNNYGGAGGNGGGIVYLLCYSTISGSGVVTSNGDNGASTTSSGTDGAGGGGAGGTIFLDATGLISGITANANGGNGGNQNVGLFVAEAEGPGGGGGGGYIAASSGAITRTANGGLNGTTNSNSLTEFIPNGATKGGAGMPSEPTNTFHIITSTVYICPGTSTVLSFSTSGPVPPSTTFAWFNQAVGGTQVGSGTTFTTPVLSSGQITYYVSACPGASRFPVQVQVSQVTAAIAATSVCSGNATDFTGTGTASSGSISSWDWDFGDGTGTSSSQNPSYTYSSANSYTVTLTVTDNSGCTASTTQSVSVLSSPAINFSAPTTTGCAPLNVAFANTTSGASTYSWNFGDGSPASSSTSPSHIYNASGTYTVTLTASNTGCTATSTQTNMVTVNATPIASFSAPASVCLGDIASFSNLSAPNGTTITGYSWNFGDASALSTSTNPTHTYLSASTFNVVLTTSSATCSDDTTIAVTISPAPVVNFSTSTTTGCSPMSVSFSNTTTGSPTYSWNFGDGSLLSSTTSPTHIYSASGTYTVTLIASIGTCKDTLIRTNYIQVGVSPLASFSSVASICLGDSIRFTNASTGTITSYTWDFDDGTIITTATGNNQSHLYSSAGSYDVHLTVVANGCPDDTIITINVSPAPVVNFASSTLSGCGSLTANFTNTTTGTPTYSWNFGDGSPLGNTTSPSHTYTSTGVYTVTLIASQGTCGDTLVRTNYITVNTLPTSSFTTASVCLGDSVHFTNLSSGNGDPLTGVTWNYGDGNSSTTTGAHLYALAGTYNVTLTASTANCSDDTTISVTVSPGPIANFNTATVDGCGSLAAAFVNTTTGSPTYSWNFGDGSPISSTANPTHTYSTAGTYSVSLIATQGSCADTLVRTNYITIYNSPLSSFSTADVCIGDSVRFTNLSNGNGEAITNYTWNYGDGNFSSQFSQSHYYTSAGTYNVLLSIITAHCVDDTTITVTVSPGPVVNFSTPTLSSCGPLSATFVNTTSGSPVYLWNFGDGSPTTTAANPTHNYTTAGTYSVSLIASQGSCADTLTRTNYITVYNAPLSSFSTSSVCIGDTVRFSNLSSGNGEPISNYTWNFGDGNFSSQISPSHFYTAPGTYNVLLSIITPHCTDDTTIVVTVSAGPVVSFTPSATTFCGNQAVTFTNTTTGSPVYSWNFGDGSPLSSAVSPVHQYTIPGTYTVSLIATQGSCADTLVQNNLVNVYASPLSSFSTANVCLYDSVHFSNLSTISGGVITSYDWDFGDSFSSAAVSPSHFYSAPGVYNVNLNVSTANCSDDTTIVVTVNANPAVNFVSSTLRACDSITVNFNNTTTGASTYAWNFGDGVTSNLTSPSHLYNVEGTYSVLLTATSSAGCSSSKYATSMVIIKSTPQPVFSASRTSICPGDCISFSDQTAGTNTSWQWQLSGGNPATSLARNLSSVCYNSIGDYNVTLTVSNGSCTGTSTQSALIHVVNCNAKPQANFVSSDTNLCGGSCVSFVDLSLNAVNWQWQFPGATPASSSVEFPTNICYATSGVYPVTLIASNTSGADTFTVSSFISVSSTPTQPTFTQSGNMLTSTSANGYQWFYNGIPISGANSQQYTATLSGPYSVQITDANGCQSTSPVLQVSLVGINELVDPLSFIVYPNPSTNEIFIQSDRSVPGEISIQVVDLLGQILMTQIEKHNQSGSIWRLDVSGLSAGAYFVRVTNSDHEWKSVVVKQ